MDSTESTEAMEERSGRVLDSRLKIDLHMKFEFNWPSGFRREDVWKMMTDDGVIGMLLGHP